MRPTLKAPHWPVSSVVTLQEHNGRNAKEYNFFARRSRLAKKLVILFKPVFHREEVETMKIIFRTVALVFS